MFFVNFVLLPFQEALFLSLVIYDGTDHLVYLFGNPFTSVFYYGNNNPPLTDIVLFEYMNLLTNFQQLEHVLYILASINRILVIFSVDYS